MGLPQSDRGLLRGRSLNPQIPHWQSLSPAVPVVKRLSLAILSSCRYFSTFHTSGPLHMQFFLPKVPFSQSFPQSAPSGLSSKVTLGEALPGHCIILYHSP